MALVRKTQICYEVYYVTMCLWIRTSTLLGLPLSPIATNTDTMMQMVFDWVDELEKTDLNDVTKIDQINKSSIVDWVSFNSLSHN